MQCVQSVVVRCTRLSGLINHFELRFNYVVCRLGPRPAEITAKFYCTAVLAVSDVTCYTGIKLVEVTCDLPVMLCAKKYRRNTCL